MAKNAQCLQGRVAVVTGGARGIGQAIVERFAEAGADIAVADVISANETRSIVEECGRRFSSLVCDISNPSDVNGFADHVRKELGRADILVNNAAIMKKITFDDLSYEDWRRFFSVNLDGAFLMVKAFCEDLVESPAGRIINMASTSVWLNVPQMIHYVSAKGAIIGFTNSLATEMGAHDVTVNAIAPSLVRTPGSVGLENSEGDFPLLAAMQTLKREQRPSDVAGLAVFLASDDAAFVTGQTIAVDGGLTRR